MSRETIDSDDWGRMQIHVWMLNGRPVIKIYSKSKRDSTEDRRNTHEYACLDLPISRLTPFSIILGSLGLPLVAQERTPAHHTLLSNRLQAAPRPRSTITSVILEAEMLPYNELDRQGGRGPGIEEFWHLTSLGARGGSQRRDGSVTLSWIGPRVADSSSIARGTFSSRTLISCTSMGNPC